VAARRVSSFDQLPVAGGGVGQGARRFRDIVAPERDDQFSGADIQAGADHRGLFVHQFYGLVLAVRVPDLMHMSSTDLVYAGSPPRQRGGGLRYSAVWTKKVGGPI